MDDKQRDELLEQLKGKLTRAVTLYLENCARCGVCVEACHVYASSPEVRYTPVARAQNVRRIFEKYFKLSGKLAPWLNEAVELTEQSMNKVYETAYTCTGCRRCVTYCPFGIDTQQIQGIAKAMLHVVDMEPKILSMLADMSVTKGENWENTAEMFEQAVRAYENEVIGKWREEGGEKTKIPMNVKGADVLYVALAGKHSMVPAASIMNAAGENWSLSYFEAVNFGAFVGNSSKTNIISKRIVDEATRLGVKEVVICECGTAYRVMKHMTGKHPFNVITFAQLIHRYLKGGKIKIDRTKLADKGRMTYHDPCQIGRNGGVYEEPREIIDALTEDFVDMIPNRVDNWCCGGGGGLVAMGEKDFRMMSGKVKADQIKATGAKTIVTACENCHTQLGDLNDHYKLGGEVLFLSGAVADALIVEE